MSTTSSEVMHVRFRTVDGIAIRYAESDERSAWVMGGYQNTGA